MQLAEWVLSKFKPQLVLPALFRIAAALAAAIAITGPGPQTQLHTLADLLNRWRASTAQQLVLTADQWLRQSVQHREALGTAALMVLLIGAVCATHYRVNPVANLGVSTTWLAVAALSEAGWPTWLILLALPIAVVTAALWQFARFGGRYHRLNDRIWYGVTHLIGSLLDPLHFLLTLPRCGPACLDWQWIIVNPRAEFWRRIDTQPDTSRIMVQPKESMFVMFGPREIADDVRDDPRLTRCEFWRMAKRHRDVEWGLS